MLDPATGATLADFNGDHYFTPASNTKILTLATCLEVLGDTVPGMQYTKTIDSKLVIRGTADPTFLHPGFQSFQKAFHWLENQEDTLIVLFEDHFSDNIYGKGWAMDDYFESYQVGRSALTIYGNCYRISTTGDSLHPLKVEPSFFGQRIKEELIWKSWKKQWGIPSIEAKGKFEEKFIPVPPTYNLYLLSDTLNKSIEDYALLSSRENWRTLYSTPIDTVLRRMMHQSDNFIAEQMLLVCAGVKFDLLKQDTMIKWMLDSTLTSLPQRPKWVDGSGLSRYNLMTPQSIVHVLLKLWKEQPRERILSLFPAGGVSGTIAEMYPGKYGKPYVFAKTGGMSGVHCLSGYIVCKSGKVLIFSFMHNNFVGSNKAWKAEMQRLLEQIRDRF
ncbi:MAG: D-alanyl-D-alanine carboxypeptidase [Saprospiraceae bacterium]|nr:D-alanyl-D-alanine carboxypeptidase [Saprospiraceae bacterium]